MGALFARWKRPERAFLLVSGIIVGLVVGLAWWAARSAEPPSAFLQRLDHAAQVTMAAGAILAGLFAGFAAFCAWRAYQQQRSETCLLRSQLRLQQEGAEDALVEDLLLSTPFI